ncbi:MAG TPA: 4-(cytidine 5'-diphospho)-2-C-methyl-D-erythritol kinase [Candidatus Saccharimonadales bacterium]|jgi:4-diphosphocytidyl-2-C-methyl-D-erythritol kinase|nr:4-(cytidine 5'-diphospho)-2-C-methyl-D-erythritol kinase [Candidatus Saccharimonadales bacterium]
MAIAVRSFAKINIGLRIGPLRPDRFHELRTVYQTLAIHDVLRIEVRRGDAIEIHCDHPGVPTNETNTCWRITERVLKALDLRRSIRITIEKNLPIQGGLGAASSNGVATLLALEKALRKPLAARDRLRIAGEVGSDLPLFLVGGTVLGIGRGEQVYPLEDLPSVPCVVATPPVGVSTPVAFADWDKNLAGSGKLTGGPPFDRMTMFSDSVYEWLNGVIGSTTGVPANARDRAEALLLGLVRTGIENDFESVVFPMYPVIGEVKRVLASAGARYASLSGSGSTVYGLFRDRESARKGAQAVKAAGVAAAITTTATLRRADYWNHLFME